MNFVNERNFIAISGPKDADSINVLAKGISPNSFEGLSIWGSLCYPGGIKFSKIRKPYCKLIHKAKTSLALERFRLGQKDLQDIINHASHLESLSIGLWIIEFDNLVLRKESNLKYLAIKSHQKWSSDIWGKDFYRLEILLRAISKWSLKHSLKTLHIGDINIEENFVKELLTKYDLLDLEVIGARVCTERPFGYSDDYYSYSLKD